MRMNDCHENDNIDHYSHSSFWVKHPEYWRTWPKPRSGYFDRCLNYGIQAVRDYHMALIREYLERYDLDGLELDWMRESFGFKPGEEDKGRTILTTFMTEVRRLADQQGAERGRPIKIAVRVPALPEAATGKGLDAVAWAREGLVDMLIPSLRWQTADFDIPIDRWRRLLGDACERVTLAAGMERRIQPHDEGNINLSCRGTIRGFTAAMLERGADQIYLFNHFDDATFLPGEYLPIYKEAGRLETVINKSRRHVVTFHDIGPGREPPALPAGLEEGGRAQFAIYIGPRPTTGRVVIRVGLDQAPDVHEARLFVRVNSADCTAIEDHPKPSEFSDSACVAQFDVPLAAARRGYNKVEVGLPKGGEQRIVWMEIYIVP